MLSNCFQSVKAVLKIKDKLHSLFEINALFKFPKIYMCARLEFQFLKIHPFGSSINNHYWLKLPSHRSPQAISCSHSKTWERARQAASTLTISSKKGKGAEEVNARMNTGIFRASCKQYLSQILKLSIWVRTLYLLRTGLFTSHLRFSPL